MSFASERAVYYFVDQFQYCWLIGCIKTPVMLKRQRFKDNESDTIEPRVSKRPRVDEYDNEEVQGLDEYQSKGGRYVLLLPCPQKESNHLTDLGEVIRSLNHLVCISKLPYQIIANFVLEFPGGKGSKAQKKIHISRLQEGMESHSASTTSTASGTTNARRLIRERLKSHPSSNHHQSLESQTCPNQR